jgi:hypothetical protein
MKTAIIGSKPFQVAFLAVALFFIKPVDFLPCQQTSVACLMRRKWVRWLPFLPAAMFAKTFYSFLMWTALHMQAREHAPDAIVHQFLGYARWSANATGAFMALAIYGLSGCRYIFHRSLVRLWQHAGVPGVTAPLNYYIVNTAAWATWLAAYAVIVEAFIEENGIDFREALNRLVLSHPNIVIAVCFIVVTVVNRVSRNSREGMTAVYGGSRVRLLVADGLACVVAVGMLLVIAHLGSGRPVVAS